MNADEASEKREELEATKPISCQVHPTRLGRDKRGILEEKHPQAPARSRSLNDFSTALLRALGLMIVFPLRAFLRGQD
jgi:hypothetical protein